MADDPDDLPVFATTGEVATLLDVQPSAVRVRVARGQLHAAGRLTDGTLLFTLADVFDAPRNQRRRDKRAEIL